MTIELDQEYPLTSLKEEGADYRRVQTSSTSSINIGGVPISSSSSHGTRYEWSLPSPSTLQAVFVEEGLGDKLVKIFKKELQVGDETFDDAVYIDTEDKESTASFLQDEAVRNTVFGIVSRGGQIAINGTDLVYEIPGNVTDEEVSEMARFVATIMQDWTT